MAYHGVVKEVSTMAESIQCCFERYEKKYRLKATASSLKAEVGKDMDEVMRLMSSTGK